MKNLANQKIVKIASHRNGISGLSFHVAIVNENDDNGGKRDMLVIRFDKEATKENGMVVCAAF